MRDMKRNRVYQRKIYFDITGRFYVLENMHNLEKKIPLKEWEDNENHIWSCCTLFSQRASQCAAENRGRKEKNINNNNNNNNNNKSNLSFRKENEEKNTFFSTFHQNKNQTQTKPNSNSSFSNCHCHNYCIKKYFS